MAGAQITVTRFAGFALVNPATGHFHKVLDTFGPTVALFVNERDAHFVNRNAHGGRLAVVAVQLGAVQDEAPSK